MAIRVGCRLSDPSKELSKLLVRSILVQGEIRGFIPKIPKPAPPLQDEAPKLLALRKERVMKLRIRGNSIRLRLGKSEVAQLAKDGSVHASIRFSGVPRAQLGYSLATSPIDKEISAQLVGSEIKVTVPEKLAREWASSEQIGLKHEQQIDREESLAIIIEKDFHSLEPRPDENQSDSFANPFEGKKHCNHP